MTLHGLYNPLSALRVAQELFKVEICCQVAGPQEPAQESVYSGRSNVRGTSRDAAAGGFALRYGDDGPAVAAAGAPAPLAGCAGVPEAATGRCWFVVAGWFGTGVRALAPAAFAGLLSL
jgi:hypothetical protein